MRSASIPFFSDPDRAPDRRRAVALILTLIAHALLLFMLLWLAPNVTKLPGAVNKLITFNVLPEAQSEKAKSSASSAAAAAHHQASSAPQPPALPKPPIILPAPPWVLTPGLEKFNVKQVPVTKPAEPTPTTENNDEDSAYTEGSGHSSYGPNADGSTGGGTGERLYYAEWYREPTDAELSTYLPKENRQSGWGEIACQTIEHYHVDNCRELGEGPLGTGLARAVRQAAWQFLVRPPHVGGKSLIGAWVRIRITYTETYARAFARHR
jgi:protein TonB